MGRTNSIEDELIMLRNMIEELQEREYEADPLFIPLNQRFLLTVEEASFLYHIGTKNLYQLMKADVNFKLKVGTKFLIKRELFEDYLRRAREI